MQTWLNPTTFLFAAISVAHLSILTLSWKSAESLGPLGWVAVFLAQTFLVFMAFTPLHEASHGIASKNRKLNEFVLFFCSIFFASDTGIFRAIHTAHHAFTNHSDKDPDHFTSGSTLAIRWLKSFALIFHYYVFGWNNLSKRTPYLKLHVALAAVFPWVILAVGLSFGKLTWALAAWVLPAYVAMGTLSFVNTAWPHDVNSDTSRMKNTRAHLLPGWAQALMCNQNLHLVHHLQPTLPWWKYPAQFDAQREKLLAQGARVVDYR